jgi:hypothetical protein
MLLKCGLMTLREKKGWARKGAETQRNKEWPHKDAKVQRKIPLRLGGFARRKKKLPRRSKY